MQDQRIGRYRLLRQIGQGGMGTVYEAVDDAIGRHVALKVLGAHLGQNPEFVQRMRNEARAVNIVRHAGLVQISEFSHVPGGVTYLVMEYLSGESLQARIGRCGGRMPLLVAARLWQQIASAVAAAHERGIIHRDLKPGNVMLITDPDIEGGERVKLLDFGIAKIAAELHSASLHFETVTGMMMGTPLYMAPEQFHGARRAGAASDVYSLGVIAYQLLSGRLPFQAPTPAALLLMLEGAPPPLSALCPEVPPALSDLVHAMLQRDPAARPSMREVDAQLRQWLSQGGQGRAEAPVLSGGRYLPRRALGPLLLSDCRATVYEAAHQDDPERQVLLVSAQGPAPGIERLRGQARALSATHGPGLMKVLDYERRDGGLTLIIERPAGETLAEFLAARRSSRRRPPDRALRRLIAQQPVREGLVLGRQMLAAIAAARAEGILCGEVTEEMMLVIRQGQELQVKIWPFGLGKLLLTGQGPGQGAEPCTEVTPLGAGDGEVADVKALGGLLQRLLPAESLNAALPRAMARELSDLLERMSGVLGARRPALRAVARQLDEALVALDRPAEGSHRWAWGAVALVLLGVGGGAMAMVVKERGLKPQPEPGSEHRSKAGPPPTPTPAPAPEPKDDKPVPTVEPVKPAPEQTRKDQESKKKADHRPASRGDEKGTREEDKGTGETEVVLEVSSLPPETPPTTVQIRVEGDGAVESFVGGKKHVCRNASCDVQVPAGGMAQLFARPEPLRFIRWEEGPCRGAAPSCDVPAGQAARVRVRFVPGYRLTVQTEGTGQLSYPSCKTPNAACYEPGSKITLKPVVPPGTDVFWYESCKNTKTNQACVLVMDRDHSVAVNFVPGEGGGEDGSDKGVNMQRPQLPPGRNVHQK